MLPCPSCTRHVRGEERACPFCFSPLQSTPAKRVHAAVMVIAVGAVLSACGPAESDSGDMADASSSSSGGVGSGSTGTSASGTTDPLPGTTTTDPDATTSGATSVGDTTTGGNSTTLDDDTSDDSCGGFYGGCPTDIGPSYECDVFMQDCGEGEKCAPWANDGGDIWNANRCTPLDPTPAAPGEPCTAEGSGFSGIDSCALGAMCFYVDAKTDEGVCIEMCTNSEEAPVCLEGTCIVQFDGVLPLCFETCDPEVASCAKDEACEPVADKALDTDVCTPA